MTFDMWLVACTLLLIRLPVLLGQPYAWPLRWLVLSPFLLSIVLNLSHLHKRSMARPDGSLVMLIVGYLGVVSLSFMRTIVDGRQPVAVTADSWMVVVVVGTFSVLACLSAPSEEEQNNLLRAILLGCIAYLAVNVLLYFGGIEHAEVIYTKAFPLAILGSLGIRASAAVFPMAGGINSFGAVGGAALAMSGAVLVGRKASRGMRQLALAGLALGIVVVVMTDARAALALGLASIGLMGMFRGRATSRYSLLLALPVLGPLLLIVGIDAVPDSRWESIGASARLLLSLSNRESIWRAILKELADFQPVHLVGFGAYGQITSGLSQSYSHFFAAYNEPSAAGAHNAFLQQVIETGYVGAALVLGTLVLAMRRLAARVELGRGSRPGKPMLGLFVFIAVIGILESSWSPEGQELQILMMQGLAWTAMLPRVDRSMGDGAAIVPIDNPGP